VIRVGKLLTSTVHTVPSSDAVLLETVLTGAVAILTLVCLVARGRLAAVRSKFVWVCEDRS
jgi:hypothetical protein